MVNLTAQDTARLIAKMRALYGRKFDQQWADVAPDALAEVFLEALTGLSVEEITRGMNRMMREPWPPTVPEFRSWCEQGGAWFTADEAWAMALHHYSSNKNEITECAKSALYEVKFIIENEGQSKAARAFKDTYVRNVERAKADGKQQKFWQPIALPKPPEPEFKPMTAEDLELAKERQAQYLANLKELLKGSAV